MSDEVKPKTDAQVIAADSVELQMYKDYLRATMTMDELAAKYGMSASNLYVIAKANKWKDKRRKAKERAYSNLDEKYKNLIVDLVSFIDRDAKLLMQKCLKENREMTMQERSYMISLFEKYTKEQKLTDGKPTEITGGTSVVRHEVILPPGAKRFGVMPPDARVTEVEYKVIEQKKSEEPVPEDDEDDFDT